MAVRHLTSLLDWRPDEVAALLDLAHAVKARPAAWRDALAGRSLAMIFQKRSTRTRVSFEVGMTQLGGHAVFLSAADIQIGRGETIADTARVLSHYVDAIMARVHGHDEVEELARWATVPVVNGLSDRFHPCQALSDCMTLQERYGRDLRGRKLAYVGDGNNMAHSLLLAGALVGMKVAVASPAGYAPEPAVVARAAEIGPHPPQVTEDPAEAVAGADAVYTDVWTSMGQETERDRRLAAFQGYTVDAALMARAAPHACFMHCLPAHRGEEVAADVVDGPRSIVFPQAGNRLHLQKALLLTLLGADAR